MKQATQKTCLSCKLTFNRLTQVVVLIAREASSLQLTLYTVQVSQVQMSYYVYVWLYRRLVPAKSECASLGLHFSSRQTIGLLVFA